MIGLRGVLRLAAANDESLEADGRRRASLSVRRGGQLHEDAVARTGIEKGDTSGQALARRFVEERHSLRLERGQIGIDARRLQAEVMQSFAALGEETRHTRVVTGGLEKLDFAVSRSEEGRAHALVGNLR